MTRRLMIVARGNAVRKDDAILFQRQDGLLLNGLCAGLDEFVCLVPVLDSSNPLFEVFSIYDANIACDNFRVIPLPAYNSTNPKLAQRLASWIGGATQLWRWARQSHALLVFMPSPNGFAGFAIGWLLRRRMIIYYGGNWTVYNGGVKPDASASGRVYRSVAQRVKRVLQKGVFRLAPVLLIRDAKIVEALSKTRHGVFQAAPSTFFRIQDVFERHNTCTSPPVICLTVSALLPNKGIPIIFQALKRLRTQGVNVEWWHAGSSYPEYQREMEALRGELQLEDAIKFFGYCNTQELISLYRRADIFVLASYSEGFPRVLMEAMSQSLPVVATRVGGVPAVLRNGEDALLVEPGNATDLASAIESLIQDETLRQCLIRNGRQWAVQALAHANPAKQILDLLVE